MSNNIEKDNVVPIDFGTTEPRTTEMTEEEMVTQDYINNVYLSVGASTLEWAMMASKEEYLQHMLELYDAFHKDEETKPKSKLEVPKPQIILPR